MPGGARPRSGPAPDPNALRRNRPSDSMEWVRLPAGSRNVTPPTWPISTPSPRERQLWEEEWQRPQGAMWEANDQQREVALYIRALAIGERRNAKVIERQQVRQFMDGLGISTAGLRWHRWIIDHEPIAPEVAAPDDSDTDPRARFQTIDGGARTA